MSELRRDPTTGVWVIIAPERNRRPRDGQPASERIAGGKSFDPTCLFCPDNEAMLPSIIVETASIEQPGRRTRVVPNKFPAVSQIAMSFDHGAFFEAAAGRGRHEVVIESPRHDEDLTTMYRNEVRIYRSRYSALMADAGVRSRPQPEAAGFAQVSWWEICLLAPMPQLARASQPAERFQSVSCSSPFVVTILKQIEDVPPGLMPGVSAPELRHDSSEVKKPGRQSKEGNVT